VNSFSGIISWNHPHLGHIVKTGNTSAPISSTVTRRFSIGTRASQPGSVHLNVIRCMLADILLFLVPSQGVRYQPLPSQWWREHRVFKTAFQDKETSTRLTFCRARRTRSKGDHSPSLTNWSSGRPRPLVERSGRTSIPASKQSCASQQIRLAMSEMGHERPPALQKDWVLRPDIAAPTAIGCRSSVGDR
jgi:hypothetical protein